MGYYERLLGPFEICAILFALDEVCMRVDLFLDVELGRMQKGPVGVIFA